MSWVLEPHVCRHCFGRIVSQPSGGGRLYHCTNCGAEAEGDSASVVCACGAKAHRKHAGEVDLHLRCRENENRTPAFPSVIIAEAVR